MFSRRTSWDASANELTGILNSLRSSGRRVIDLTLSNPTQCGFPYPEERILRALASPGSLEYRPDPRGLLPAREAVVEYYRERGRAVSPPDIFMTASTSESYSLLFKLLCDPGDAVLVPRPSYPLFDYIAGVNDVRTESYRLFHDGRWEIDAASVRDGLRKGARAVVVIDPHNPTGSFVSPPAWEHITEAAASYGAALIVDEVFTDYAIGGSEGGLRRVDGGSGDDETTGHGTGGRVTPAGGNRKDVGMGAADSRRAPLTFLLNGLSKTAALPQLKLGWIAIAGGGSDADEAATRLEILNDAFLSANTPAQAALAELLDAGRSLRPSIVERLTQNNAHLRRIIGEVPGCSLPAIEAGWNALLRLPAGLSDSVCTENLLRDEGVYCYPGFFFDFEGDDTIVLSLLTPPGDFVEGVTAIARWIGGRTDGAG